MSSPVNEPNAVAPPWWRGNLGRLLLYSSAIVAVVAAAFVAPYLNLTPRTSPPPATTLDRKAVAVAPGVYLLGKMSPASAYAVDTSDGLVLIDTGMEASARTVKEQLAELRLDVSRLRAILLTHAHGDHSLGAEQLRAATGAKVHAGKADAATLRKGGPRESFFSTFYMPHVGTHPTTVDVDLVGDEVLSFGDARFEVLATPGHTPGSVCYLLHKGGQRMLFTGDVIQAIHPETHDALGTYAAYLPPLYGGNARDYLATLKKLRALPVPDLVLPGHPRMDSTPQAPNIGAERWHAILDGGIAEMDKLLARYAADGANFLDGVFKELLPGLYYLGNVGEQAVYCLNTPKGLFLVDAPGGTALVEFLTERLKKLGLTSKRLTAVLLTSADAATTAGLSDLVRQTGCKVVVARAGQDTIAKLVPAGTQIITEDDLKSRDWLDVRTLPLLGRGVAPLAYVLRHANKAVLLSGNIPVKASVPALERLHLDIRRSGSIPQYVHSLVELSKLAPDLWLPAVPVEGQNANLYDGEWEKVLLRNRQALAW